MSKRSPLQMVFRPVGIFPNQRKINNNRPILVCTAQQIALAKGMLFTLPDDQVLYSALVARDPSYEGRAYVGVKTTGIFCRLTCPARKPKPENCTFYETAGQCLDAGFRACKRCFPLQPAADADPMIASLLQALEARPDYRWREGDVQRMGLDPSTVRRSFKRHFGMTFLEMARQRRLRDGFSTLSAGGKVIEAQVMAGFDSASAFRTAFARLIGMAPGDFKPDALLFASWIDTPLGAMIAVCDNQCLHLLEFPERKALPRELKRLLQFSKGAIGLGRTKITDQIESELARFFDGTDAHFQTPLAYHGTPFTQHVWQALQAIPAGQTCSYSEVAAQIGQPTASRAVARANGANQIALVIPCHRVIGADGSLTGYGGGLWRKQRLIEFERAYS